MGVPWFKDPKKYVINEWGQKEMTVDERMKRLHLGPYANKKRR